MKKLIKGLREFQANYVSTHRELLEQLAHGQKPRVLFITCSDSRIDPNLITQTDIGELFIIRNAGNIIPPYGAANGGEGASVEYAINALGIDQIIVCGHSHCGAMKGLLKLNQLQEEMPLVYDWLRHTEATRRLLKENYGDYSGDELLEIAIAENVLTQIENLKTYPVVHSRIFKGDLKIYGWIYHLETGEVLAYDPETHAYMPPQSQLGDGEEAAEPSPSSFGIPSYVGAGVTCEVPQYYLEHPAEVAESTPYGQNPMPGNGHGNGHGSVSSEDWLSPLQRERIYRGTR
jgi:carbonic anhydrase